MTRAALARIWSVLGTLLAVYASGTWIIIQGGKSLAELPGLDGRAPVASAYEGALIIGVLLGLLSTVGIQFARTANSNQDSLLPLVAISELGTHRLSSWAIRLYQIVLFIIFIIIPAAALYKLNDTVFQQGILWTEGDPALGSIAAKNGYRVTEGSSAMDRQEFSCRQEILRGKLVWLSNMRCDLVKAKHLKPFDKDGRTPLDETKASSGPACVLNLAADNSNNHKCSNVLDISEICESSERRCRGVEWFPIGSPLGLFSAATFGWVMTVWLITELWIRWARRLRRQFRTGDTTLREWIWGQRSEAVF
jgi:hypothetical protein